VLDTNVLISALVGHGKPRRLVTMVLERHQIVSSRQMLAEFVEVMSREKFAEVGRPQVDRFLSILIRRAILVSVKLTRKVISQDPEDDIVLSTALEGNASHIVSGDKHLLHMKTYRGVKIVTVEEILEILGLQTTAS
jgi:putative PIN family toxin of toxin-antitoxin system